MPILVTKWKKTVAATALAGSLALGGIYSQTASYRYRFVPAPAQQAGLQTCAQQGITCFFETSFTSAQGWTVDHFDSEPSGACSGNNGLDGVQNGINEEGDDDVDGQCAQVVDAANHSGGHGGKGFRFWFGDTVNEVSGTLGVDFIEAGLASNACASTPCALYMRWYVRYASGMAIASSSGHKTVYFSGSRCAAGNGCYWLFGSPDSVEANRVTVGGSNKNNNLSSPAQYGYDFSIGGGANSSDGNWHCFQYKMTMESSGSAADGAGEWWIDGTKVYENLVTDWNTFGTGWPGFELPENGNMNPGNGTSDPVDYDDLALSVTAMPNCAS